MTGPIDRNFPMTPTHTSPIATALPLVGAAVLIASIFLPGYFAAAGWLLGVLCFLMAATIAIVPPFDSARASAVLPPRRGHSRRQLNEPRPSFRGRVRISRSSRP